MSEMSECELSIEGYSSGRMSVHLSSFVRISFEYMYCPCLTMSPFFFCTVSRWGCIRSKEIARAALGTSMEDIKKPSIVADPAPYSLMRGR